MNNMINNISFPRTNRRRQMTTSSGNKIPGSNSSVGHKMSWGQRQRQGKGRGGCDLNHHHHHGIIRTPLKLDKADGNSEEEEDDDDEDNEGTTSTEFTFDLDDDSTTSLNISEVAFSSPTADVDSVAAANDNDDCVPSSTTTTATSVSSTRGNNTLNTTKKKTSRHRHQVHFGSIEIHKHTIQLGGAGIPSTSGPSLSLSWHKQGPSTTIASVIEYEEARPLGYLPRKGTEMFQARTQRIDLLLSVGYTYREIMECTKECNTIRTQRLQTRKQIQLSTFLINILRWKTRRNKLLREKKKNRN